MRQEQQSEDVDGIKLLFSGRVSTHFYTHFSDSISDTTKLGQFVDAFFSDDCAVHVEAHSFSSPEKFLGLRQGCHRAAKVTWHRLRDAQATFQLWLLSASTV